ncbi:uncharacterized protein LOC132277936 [Cornus florida]|uniref:uncharacterized protein LOC132277936 n=1 Tax=Cornus florida TaxID=4283 RepID=UPI002898D252|nr:uncharacterized protein LOC132277936 [Cornus florida]
MSDEPNDTTTLTNAQRQQLKDHKKKDAKALGLIQQGVADTIFPRIINASKANEAWDILENEYKGSTKVRTVKLQSLRRDFENMKMKEMELLKDYFSRIMEVVNQMKTYGEDISNQRIVEKILISLPEKYDSIVTAIEETKELENLSVEELMGSIKVFEQRLSRRYKKTIESVFQSKLNVSSKNQEKYPSSFDRSKGESSKGGRYENSKRKRKKFKRKRKMKK